MSSAAKASDPGSFKTFLEMIKFEHTLFALPHAFIGMMFGSLMVSHHPWPGFRTFGWILVAMVSCRTAAMTYNRIADRDIDAKNERTKSRAIPAGLLGLGQARGYLLVSVILFFAASALLNGMTLALSPVALGITLFYSQTKRFTWLCHLILGASLGIAPAAAYLAVTGEIHLAPMGSMFFGVALWTAGFDIIYAMQDEEFDRRQGLHSIPARFGPEKALAISRCLHFLSVISWIWPFTAFLGTWGWLMIGVAAAGLIYEQSLVKPRDLRRVNFAFFTLNGYLSVAMLGIALLAQLGGSP